MKNDDQLVESQMLDFIFMISINKVLNSVSVSLPTNQLYN